MRKIFSNKIYHSNIDQGSIINNCIAEDYPHSAVWGCIITPRCDLAHQGKVSTVHYLPIINIEDWIRNEAYNILKKQWVNALEKKLNTILKDAGSGDCFLNKNLPSEDILTVARTLIKKEAVLKSFETDFSIYLKQTDNDFKQSLTQKQQQGNLKNLIKDLVKGNNHAFYFIESWDNPTESLPYKVILLRDIRRLRLKIALKFASGFLEEDMSPEDIIYNDLATSGDCSNLYYIIEQIKSPFIEHILQAFSYNFCRIGVEDINNIENVTDNIVDQSLKILLS